MQCIVTCVICWVCGMLGQTMRGGQSGADREKAERERPAGSKSSLSSFLAGFPKARYDRDAALKVLPLSFVFVVMIVSNQLTLKYVEVSFYNVARYEIRPSWVNLIWRFWCACSQCRHCWFYAWVRFWRSFSFARRMVSLLPPR